MIDGCKSGKNSVLNLLNQQSNIDKMYLHAKDPFEAKYQFLSNKRERTGYRNDIDDIYSIFEKCNPNKKRKILIILILMI